MKKKFNYDDLLISKVDYLNNNLPNIEKNLDENMKFKDPFFPHGKDIVKIKRIEEHIDSGKLVWKRISDIIDIKKDESDKLPITQRGCGDCYFISFLRSLQFFRQDYYHLLFGICFPEIGYYEFYFFTKEKKQVIVFVDDYILVNEHDSIPIFATLKEEERYTVGRNLLIEKAFAKMKGSYGAIEGGYNASFPVVGFNSQLLRQDFLSKKDEEIYERLTEEVLEKNIVLCGTLTKDPRPMKTLFCGHMYSLISTEKQTLYILTLNNPHGKNPAVSLGMQLAWRSKIEDEIIEYNKNNRNNGNIKILVTDLQKHFNLVEICSFSDINKRPIIDGIEPIPPQVINDLYFKRKNIFDALGIPKKDQIKFIMECKGNLGTVLYISMKLFMHYGTSRETFYNRILAISNANQNPSIFQNIISFVSSFK